MILVNAMHIAASVFINDDERGFHTHYEKWLEGLALHAPTSQYQHNRTGEDACSERSDRNADAHLKRAAETDCTLAAETGRTLPVMGRDAQRWSR